MSDAPILVDVLPAHRFDEAKLRAYLADRIEGAGEGFQVRQFQGGQSNPTFLIDAGGRRYVLRKKPPGQLLPSAHQVEREYRIMAALRDTDVPVPNVRLLCEDPSVIGTAFYLMDYIEGRVFTDPMLPELDRDTRPLVFEQLAGTLARLHRVDWRAVGLADFGRPDGYIARQIDRWTKQYQASKTGDLPAMDKLMAWLPENAPALDETSIAHGDYRLGNAMYHPQRPELVAVLDWELSTLGHPLADLAYCCLPYHMPEGARGLGGRDLSAQGIPDEEAFLRSYCREAGRDEIPHWNFFLAFALFRSAAITQGVYARALQGNASNANAHFAGAHARLLAELGWQQAQRGSAYA